MEASGERPGRSVLVDGGAAGERWEGLLARAVLRVLESEGVPAAEISVALLDDAGIRRLNREHLDRDRTTDVLAFPLWEKDDAPVVGAPVVVGDIYVGLERAELQAKSEGVPLPEELVRLAIHGTLHVLGWDHPEGEADREESAMFRRQEELVRMVFR